MYKNARPAITATTASTIATDRLQLPHWATHTIFRLIYMRPMFHKHRARFNMGHIFVIRRRDISAPAQKTSARCTVYRK